MTDGLPTQKVSNAECLSISRRLHAFCLNLIIHKQAGVDTINGQSKSIYWIETNKFWQKIISYIILYGPAHDMSELTHCGLVTPYGGSDLGHHWLR